MSLSVPSASILDVAGVVAAAALLVGLVVRLVQAFRERGAPAGPAVPPLELAQQVTLTVAIVALAAGLVVDSEVTNVVFLVSFLATLGLGAVRWRRGERPFPSGL